MCNEHLHCHRVTARLNDESALSILCHTCVPISVQMVKAEYTQIGDAHKLHL